MEEAVKLVIERASPMELPLLLVVAGAIFLGWRGLLAWRDVQLASAASAWKTEVVRRGLTADETARLFRAGQRSEGKAEGWFAWMTEDSTVEDVTRMMSKHRATDAQLEEAMSLLNAADDQARKDIGKAIGGLREPTPGRVLGILRGFLVIAPPPASADLDGAVQAFEDRR